jgi:hypothetical protein
VRQVRDLGCAGFRIVLELEVRRIACRRCGGVKRERLDFLADNPHYTKRFAHYIGRRCAQASIRDVGKELNLDWHTVKTLEMQYMRAQIARAGTPGPEAIGIDEISIRKSLPPRRRGVTATVSWSAIFIASGRSGSAARIAPKPAWKSSMPGWGSKRAAKSSLP